MASTDKKHINVKVGVYPNWWYKNYGISYEKKYYHDPQYRIEVSMEQERILYDRFGDVGMGSKDPEPNPFVDYGMVLLPEVFGCEIKFFKDALPWAVPANLNDEEIEKLEVPDLFNSQPMKAIIKQMDYLEDKYGRVTGGINTTGVLNLGLKIRGEQLYLDFYENPELVHKLFQVCTNTIIELANYVRKRTGNLSAGVTPMFPPEAYALPNCTAAQISNDIYEEFVLPYEIQLSEHLQPFGVHHCGSVNNIVEGYSKIKNIKFIEVGPQSDLQRLRKLMPKVFVNARIDPVRMLKCSAKEIEEDVKYLIDTGAPLELLSIDAVGCDYGTPDENIRTMINTAIEYSMQKMN